MSIVRRHSRKRDAILECLRCTTSHPTAEWVYNQLKPTIPDLSLATVYRNLAALSAAEDFFLPTSNESTVPGNTTKPLSGSRGSTEILSSVFKTIYFS